MKTTAIFDLDGTLLDTITDIASSVNEILKKHALPSHSIQEYKYFVGSGFDTLVRRAVPKEIEGERFIRLRDEMKNNYRNKYNDLTKPYEGIIALLKELNSRKINIAVLSNKPHEFVKPTLDAYFEGIHFDLMLGARQGIPIKPAPQGVFNIFEALNVDKSECIFIGDTAIDIQTGVSAGVDTIGVLWGFRTEDELLKAGANHIVSHPKEILDYII